MLSKDDRATIRAATLDDPDFVIDLLEESLYNNAVGVTDATEARMLIEELSHLCATRLEPGTAARVARFLQMTTK